MEQLHASITVALSDHSGAALASGAATPGESVSARNNPTNAKGRARVRTMDRLFIEHLLQVGRLIASYARGAATEPATAFPTRNERSLDVPFPETGGAP